MSNAKMVVENAENVEEKKCVYDVLWIIYDAAQKEKERRKKIQKRNSSTMSKKKCPLINCWQSITLRFEIVMRGKGAAYISNSSGFFGTDTVPHAGRQL